MEHVRVLGKLVLRAGDDEIESGEVCSRATELHEPRRAARAPPNLHGDGHAASPAADQQIGPGRFERTRGCRIEGESELTERTEWTATERAIAELLDLGRPAEG